MIVLLKLMENEKRKKHKGKMEDRCLGMGGLAHLVI
jgi:hypothetical protein